MLADGANVVICKLDKVLGCVVRVAQVTDHTRIRVVAMRGRAERPLPCNTKNKLILVDRVLVLAQLEPVSASVGQPRQVVLRHSALLNVLTP